MSSANWSYFFSNLDSLYFFSSDYPGEDFQNYVEWKWQEWTFFSYSISFRGNAFSFSALSMMPALGLSYMAFIMLKNTKMKIWSYTEYIIQSNKNAFICFLPLLIFLSEKLISLYNWFLCFYFSTKTLPSHQWFYLWLMVRKPLLSALLSNLTMKKLTCVHIRADILTMFDGWHKLEMKHMT